VQVTVDSRRVSLLARARPWVAVIVATIIFALIPLIGLQLIFAANLRGTSPDPPTPIRGGATWYAQSADYLGTRFDEHLSNGAVRRPNTTLAEPDKVPYSYLKDSAEGPGRRSRSI
jgi:hypothetical protein